MQYDPAGLTRHLGALGDVLASAALRWDGLHYVAIASHGYRSSGDAVFFPLYPLLSAAVGAFTGSAVIGGALVSLAGFAIALALLHRLTAAELGRPAADTTVLLLSFAPLSLFFTAIYTEGLFLALSVGSLYAARRGRGVTAGGLAALAAVTRVSGVLLVIPVAMMLRSAHGTYRRRDLASLLSIPAALGCYLGYLGIRGYGALAPFTGQAGAHGHRFAGPLTAIVSSWQSAAAGLGSILSGTERFYSPTLIGPLSIAGQSILLASVMVIALWALVMCLRRLPAAFGVYSALALVICVSSPVSGQPLLSLDRYALTIFPLWMAAGARLSESRMQRVVLVLSAGALAFYSFQFATWSYVA
jgi:hypothetical protein